MNSARTATGTEKEAVGLAKGGVMVKGGGSREFAYVRHTKETEQGREQLAQNEAQELLDNGARWLDDPNVPRYVVLSGSTPEGLRNLAERERADLIVFGS